MSSKARPRHFIFIATVLAILVGLASWGWFSHRPQAYAGVNVLSTYSSAYAGPGCEVMDMEGRVLRELPGSFCNFSEDGERLAIAGPFKNGEADRLTVYDVTLKPVWSGGGLIVHHDIYFDNRTHELFTIAYDVAPKPDGGVYGYRELFEKFGRSEPSGIMGYDSAGKIIFKWRLAEHLPELTRIAFPDQPAWKNWPERATKINSVSVIERPLSPGDKTMFVPGNILVSVDHCSCLLLIDRATGGILWSYKPWPSYRESIHSVSVTHDGHILYFQNNNDGVLVDHGYKFSEVVKIDPYSRRKLWSYRAEKSGELFAEFGGHVQELPNENLLISYSSHALEITPDGRQVWSWTNPSLDEKGVPKEIYRVRRIDRQVWERFE